MTRIFEERANGKILIVKPEEDYGTPLFCKVCDFPMKTIDDSFSYRKVGCCSKCDNRWGSHKSGKLNEGWTPDKTTEEWSEYIEDRISMGKHLINVR